MRDLKRIFTFLLSLTAVLSYSQTGYVVADKVQKKATPFLLSDVRVTGGPFKNAMDKDATWLLSLEPDRFLHRFRLNAGLKPKGELYGGWEARGVSGHSLGHYLSACALMYAASGDKHFKDKVNYIVKEMAECQVARKTGYVGGIPDEDKIFNEVAAGDIRSQGFDLNGGWVPWYTVHKVLAGLIDTYTYTGNTQAKDIAVKLCDWIDVKFKGLTEDQWQKMLECEHGGMNEALANMYSLTGNAKYLALSHKFHHKKILDPLAQEKDGIHGVHANTQIPKIIGAARRYELTGDKSDHAISDYFWNLVTQHYSYVVGGNSDHERFAPAPDKLSEFLSTNTTETCNSYNMLRLTDHLYELEPKASYFDFYERTLYNHILASQNPEDGMVLYYLPLLSGAQKKFGSSTNDFWCCTGTGMENHAKYGQDIYYKAADGGLYVNLFIPSTLQWKEKGAKLEMTTAYPDADTVSLRIAEMQAGKGSWAMYIRRPWWAKEGATIAINGKPEKLNAAAGEYLTIKRAWKKGDVVKLNFPMSLYTEAMPDNKNEKAILYGPLVMAGRLGKEAIRKRDMPVFVATPASLTEWIKPQAANSNTFIATNNNKNLTLSPLYKVYNERYGVYWNFFSEDEWKVEKQQYEAELKAEEELERKTIDIMRIGEMQPERDHNFQGEKTNTGEVDGTRWRDAGAGGWFSFTLDTKGQAKAALQCTYLGTDVGNREFDILVDGQVIASQILQRQEKGGLYNVVYPIPEALLKNKTSITVRFQGHEGKIAGGLYGCRLIKIEAAGATALNDKTLGRPANPQEKDWKEIPVNLRPAMFFSDSSDTGFPVAKDPSVIHFGDQYFMYYTRRVYANGQSGTLTWHLGIARSTDLVHWEKVTNIPLEKSYEQNGICAADAVIRDGKIHLFYQTAGNGAKDAICHAISTDGIHFTRDESNPIFHPTPAENWTNGRAIDAEVYPFKNQWFLYFATRSWNAKVQQQGVAVAPANTDFRKDLWKQASDSSILKPELPWEGECIEGASIIKKNGKLYMFYAGAFNNAPQQIGVAISTDGIHWARFSDKPFLANGQPGTWNTSESGHPCIFEDTNGKTYLFFQGNNDNGKTWYLSKVEVGWNKKGPYLMGDGKK